MRKMKLLSMLFLFAIAGTIFTGCSSDNEEDEEIVDYSNYQPTEIKEEDVEEDDKDSLVDEDKIYKD